MKFDIAHIKKVSAGLIMTTLICLLFWGDYVIGIDVGFYVLCHIALYGAIAEFYLLCDARKTAPFKKFGTFMVLTLVSLHWLCMPGTLEWFGFKGISETLSNDLLTLGLVITVFGTILLQATKTDNDRTYEAISTTIFGVIYVWFLASFLVKIRHLGLDGYLGTGEWNKSGTGFLISTIIVSKCADIGGYLIGRKFGKTKMIRRISPNKSYEGLVAGLLLSIAAAFMFKHLGLLPLASTWMVAVFGLSVGIMSTCGDLAESLLKRGAGTKDTADIVPGFGGTLDIIDSVLISAPFAYFLLLLFLRM